MPPLRNCGVHLRRQMPKPNHAQVKQCVKITLGLSACSCASAIGSGVEIRTLTKGFEMANNQLNQNEAVSSTNSADSEHSIILLVRLLAKQAALEWHSQNRNLQSGDQS